MISELINSVATKLVTLNPWLSEVRTVGYLQRQSIVDARESLASMDDVKSIGIDDRRGNSGFIRFQNDTHIRAIQELQSYSSCDAAGYRMEIPLRLVVVMNASIPIDATYKLFAQLNSLQIDSSNQYTDNVKVRATGGGSNTIANVIAETGKKDINNELKVLFVDFRILFDWRLTCEDTNISIDMENCECQNPLDMGCVQHCEEIELFQNSDFTGNATIRTMFNGVTVIQSVAVTDGEKIVIPVSGLNADALYNISLYNTDGDVIMIESNDPTPTLFECFKIQVNP